jgi:phosphoribosyl-AMP cyclohydrolase / phosphoribosyl-ATP pyrophosphohydrolase
VKDGGGVCRASLEPLAFDRPSRHRYIRAALHITLRPAFAVWIDDLRFDAQGLVPVVAQDATTGAVLMLAYADRHALRATMETGEAHYWSRSRGRQWRKGESSGNVQRVVEVRLDCDADAVLYRVRQQGPACHTGERDCFFRVAAPDGTLHESVGAAHVLDRLERVIAARDTERPDGSYTTYLFDKGVDKILKKLGEECTETVIAAKNADAAELTAESTDLIFHLLVLLREMGLPLGEVWEEIERRWGAAPRAHAKAVLDRDA